MAFFDTTWYVNFGNGTSTGYYAVALRPQNAAVAFGQIVRQFTAPAVGSERCYICRAAGTTANTTDATWSTGRGANITDGTVGWTECTGSSAINGDVTNTPSWAQMKAAGGAPTLGTIIKRNNGASYHLTLTSGTVGASEPAFSDTAGATVADSGVTWTCLGPVGNFTGGQAPHARLANALATNWFASGNTVYVGDNHAETQGSSNTLTPASALMAKILCHNHSGSYPPVASDITTGASLTTTGGVNNITFGGQGSFYLYGITFNAAGASNTGTITVGAGSIGQTQNWYYFGNCSFFTASASATAITLGASSTAWGIVTFNNTTVKFTGAATAAIAPYFVQLLWQNTGQILAAGSTVPTTLFQAGSASGRFNNVTLNNLDLSQLTGSLFSNAANSSIGTLVVQDCKLNAAMTITRPINTGMNVQLIRSDSAGTSYKSQRITYEGTETTETSIVRTGGAVDPTGQAQSRKLVTTADAQWLRPFKAEPMAIWNAVTGANVTATVYGTVNAGALPMNDDLWLECEYLSIDTPTVVMLDGPTSETTVTNGGLTATRTAIVNIYGGAKNVNYQSTGKYYFEVTIVAFGGGNTTGLVSSVGTYQNFVSDGTNCSMVHYGSVIYSNNASQASVRHNLTTGVVVSCAVDLTARKVWFRTNGSEWNGVTLNGNPATGTGSVPVGSGSFAPAIGFGSSSLNTAMTINFGATTYVYTPPSGFGNWPVNDPGILGKIVTTSKASVLASNAVVSADSSVWSNATPTLATIDGATTNVAMTNGNLTATHINSTTDSGARSTMLFGVGKYYFEATIVAIHGANDGVGIITFDGTFAQSGPGLNCFATFKSGNIYGNGVNSGKTLGTLVAGNVIGIAVDLDARLGWCRSGSGSWNGDATANPVTGVGGVALEPIATAATYAPACSFGSTGSVANDAFTFNFGQTAFANAAPSGFVNWVNYTPFKLTTTLSSPQPQLPGYLHARVRAAKAFATYYIDPKVELS